MSIKNFMKEEHPTMVVSSDGKIGTVITTTMVSVIRTHVYVKQAPRLIPNRLWYWIADRITVTICENSEVKK